MASLKSREAQWLNGRYLILRPETHLHPLDGPRHQPNLAHYDKVRIYEQWRAFGFQVSCDNTGRLTQRLGRGLFYFYRPACVDAVTMSAFISGRRLVSHFAPMLEYARAGVGFEEFIDHPQHWRAYCQAALANEAGRIDEAIRLYREAIDGDPNEVRFAEQFFRLRVEQGDLEAPDEELAFFESDVAAIVHADRVIAWVNLYLKAKRPTDAARLVVRVAVLLEEKLAGRLSKGRYSGDSPTFVAAKRDQFRAQVVRWTSSSRYEPMANEISRIGGLPQPGSAASAD